VVLITSLEDIGSCAQAGTACMPQTPSEWLLARYDRVLRRTFGPRGDRRRIRHDRGSNFARPIFDVLDDHPGAACDRDDRGECAYWSGEASWPEATLRENIDSDALLEMFEEMAETSSIPWFTTAFANSP
jgi:hypothetical protein